MDKKTYPYIFVPGMAGWGETSRLNAILPYWGFSHCDIVGNLRRRGYEAYAASVSPLGSAWDRACELYAELSGGTVDYGKAHSERHGHARYGRTYDRPLFARWGEADVDGDVRKVHLICHSFGGVTARLLAYLLTHGNETERRETTDGSLSPLFCGGHGGRICSITTIASPHNGTDMQHALGHPLSDVVKAGYETFHYLAAVTPLRYLYDAQLEHFGVCLPSRSLGIAEMLSFDKGDDNVFRDVCVDGSLRINRRIGADSDVYYFSFPVCGTADNGRGAQTPTDAMMKGLRVFARRIGRFRETTADGTVCDDAWLPNDGVVNTLSAGAPFTEPSAPYRKGEPIQPGVWYVMPVVVGNHGSVTGWFRPGRTVMPMYLSHIRRLDALAEPEFSKESM